MKAGELFDERFALGRCLGTGGMGSVWEARELPQGRQVALKVLHDHFFEDRELIARFLREAQTALKAQYSAHIIELLEVVQRSRGAPYLVMEYLEGETVAQILQREGRFEVPRALEIIAQTCLAITEIHSQDIIHRDIKPENIFILRLNDGTDWVKLLDFGVAKFRQPPDGEHNPLTHAGCTVGTPNYMAPEQAMAAELDHRVDVYSTGAVLYEMVTGQRPFEADNAFDVMDRVTTEEPVRPRLLRPELDERLEAIIVKAMARDRERRYPSMLDLALALETLTQADGSEQMAFDPADTLKTSFDDEDSHAFETARGVAPEAVGAIADGPDVGSLPTYILAAQKPATPIPQAFRDEAATTNAIHGVQTLVESTQPRRPSRPRASLFETYSTTIIATIFGLALILIALGIFLARG